MPNLSSGWILQKMLDINVGITPILQTPTVYFI